MKWFLIRFVNAFTKITAWPVQLICFRTKILYEDKSQQGRRIKGPAIIISNHTAVFDYAVYIFVFFGRTLRALMAEVLFAKPVLGPFLKMLGGIRVDRDSHDMGFVEKSLDVVRKGGVLLIFPESRIPKPEETRPLEFKTSAAYTALLADVPVIPVYTNGSYFNLKKRAVVRIGTPIDVREFTREDASDRENIEAVTKALRDRIIRLGEETA